MISALKELNNTHKFNKPTCMYFVYMPSVQIPRYSKIWQRLRARKVTNRRTGEIVRKCGRNYIRAIKKFQHLKKRKIIPMLHVLLLIKMNKISPLKFIISFGTFLKVATSLTTFLKRSVYYSCYFVVFKMVWVHVATF